MDQNKHFDMRYAKLTKEAVLKSLLCGAAVSFGAVFVLGTVLWFIGTDNIGLVLGILLGSLGAITVGASLVFYFAKFKPTVTSNARRIDSLGLEERVITMLELEGEDSVMANLQRNDAIKALKTVNEKEIRFKIGRNMIVTAALVAFFGLVMGTLSMLSAAGLLPSGLTLMTPEKPPEYIVVSYFAEDGGYIEGETDQLVLMGENAEPVMAIPEEGYTFEGWDDGYKKPSRFDKEIDHPLVLMAIFLPIEEDGEDPGDDAESGENGEEPGEEEGDQGESSDQPGEESDDPSQPGDSGGGKYDKANQIIDGEKYYREELEAYYRDKVMELLKKSVEELTEEERAIIEAYINIV